MKKRTLLTVTITLAMTVLAVSAMYSYKFFLDGSRVKYDLTSLEEHNPNFEWGNTL